MEIITKLSTLDIDPEDVTDAPDDAIETVFSALKMGFDDQSHYRDTRLYEDFSSKNYHFGTLEPDYVRDRAEAWVDEIKDQFLNAVNVVCNNVSKTGRLPSKEELEADTADTYRLSCAVRELDNTWWDYAEHAVYLKNGNGYPYFRIHLTDEEKTDILAHPEEYVIAEVRVED